MPLPTTGLAYLHTELRFLEKGVKLHQRVGCLSGNFYVLRHMQ